MTKPINSDTQTIVITESLKLSSQVRGTTLIDDVAVGYSESPLEGRAAHASIGPDGISHGLSGSPPRNEEGTMETCTYLVAAMNRAGATWDRPFSVGTDDDADAVCNQLNDGHEILRIQVVRAHSNAEFWKEVHANKGAVMSGTSTELASELRAPILHKAALPPVQRAELVLAISSIHTPGYVLGDVAKRFREMYGTWAEEIGFKEIWLVGPGVELTYRLA